MANTPAPLSSASGQKLFGEDLQSPDQAIQAQNNALAVAAQATQNIQDRGQRMAAQGGLLAGLIARQITGYKPPEVQKAEDIQGAFDQVDATFKPDASALPAENEANRLTMLSNKLGHLLTPSQRLQLHGQIAALRSDAWNQSRLQASDQRDQAKYAEDMRKAQEDLYQSQWRQQQAEKVEKEGVAANQWVFEFPDKSRRYAAQGGEEFDRLMGLANDPDMKVKVLGELGEVNRAEREANNATIRAQAARKPIKLTLAQQKEYEDIGQLASYVNYLDSPEGRAGMARTGGLTNVYDRGRESLGGVPVLGEVAKGLGMETYTPSTDANIVYGKLRVAAQNLIKGVPSNNDQYILELTNIKPSADPAVNAARLAAISADVKQRVRTKYAQWLQAVRENGVPQEVPPALAAAVAALGVDVNDVTNYAEEFKKLQDLRKAQSPIEKTMVDAGEKYGAKDRVDVAGGTTGDYALGEDNGDALGAPITTRGGAVIK